MNKKILQISNDFADQKIYVNLVKRLSILGYKQIVYVPVKCKSKINGNRDDSLTNVDYIYSYILKRNIIFRLRYFNKIKILFNDLEKKIDLNQIDLIHAHFLFSDGGVAYRVKRKYNIPYIVSVRASDLYTFYKKMPHLRSYGLKILREADKIVFINPSYQNFFKNIIVNSPNPFSINKMHIIPNAIDDKWFENKAQPKMVSNEIRLLYVGRIIKRKKLDVIIKTIKEKPEIDGKKIILEVVGSGKFLEVAKKMSNEQIIFHGRVSSFNALLDIYRRCHVFVMPSVKETFGLVYIEALSQGLPIVHCINEGVDGFFKPNSVGKAVKPNSKIEIINSIKFIINNYGRLQANAIQSSKKFNIDENTSQFTKIYKEILSSNNQVGIS